MQIGAALDAMDADEMDHMPLDDDEFEELEFHECTTWESDDDGNIIPLGIL